MPTGAKAVYLKAEEAPLGDIQIEWPTDMVNWSSAGITRLVTGAASSGKEPVEAEVTSSADRIFFQFVGQAL